MRHTFFCAVFVRWPNTTPGIYFGRYYKHPDYTSLNIIGDDLQYIHYFELCEVLHRKRRVKNTYEARSQLAEEIFRLWALVKLYFLRGLAHFNKNSMEKNEVLKIHCSLTKNLIYLTVSTLPNCLHDSEITAESEYCQIMRDNSIYVENRAVYSCCKTRHLWWVVRSSLLCGYEHKSLECS